MIKNKRLKKIFKKIKFLINNKKQNLQNLMGKKIQNKERALKLRNKNLKNIFRNFKTKVKMKNQI